MALSPAPKANIPAMAKLARIDLSPEECESIEHQITQILDYMDILNGIDISGVAPTAHAAEQRNVMRSDCSRNTGLRDALLAQAPAVVEEFLVKVPAVLPGEGMA